jgi:hypothetical protein
MKTKIALLITLFILSFGQAQKTIIALNLEKNVEYIQHTNAKMTLVQNVSGMKMEILVTMKGSMSYLVKAVNKNDYDMEVRYNELYLKMKTSQSETIFDSGSKDSTDIFSNILSKMKGQSFQIKMTKLGKILEVTGIDQLFESSINAFSQLSEGKKTQFKAQLEKQYGEEGMKGSIETMMAIYPTKPVSVGETWTISTKQKTGMSTKMDSKYEFKENAADYFLIAGDSKIKSIDKDVYYMSSGMPTKSDLEGTMFSQIKIDKATGWIIEAKSNQIIKGEITIKDNPKLPGGMTVPMEIKNEMLFTN